MRRLMLHGILILALAATVPASNGISETRQSFALSAQGRVLFQRGEYPQAADVFRQALASDALPTAAAAEARLYLGRIAEVEGDPSGARAILAALARSPATPPMYRAEAQFHIGRLYMLEGHPQTKPALIKVLEMPGATPEYLGKALLCLGQLAFEEADDSAAEQYLQGALAVLELKPETGAAARLLLGRLALHRRHWSTARNYFSLALGLRLNDPAETAAAHAAALFGRAAAWQAEGNMRAAHGDWRALAAMSGAPMSLCLAAQRRLDAATETTRPTPGSDGLACDFSIWAEAYAGQTDRIHLAECGAFVLFADRFEARPGERRLDFFLDLRPAGLPPEDLKVCAMIYDVNSGRRLAAKVADATSLWGWLRLDMWRYDVSPIRLRVELRTGRRLLGAVEIMAAAPEQSAAPRRQIPVILDAPSGITPLRDWPVSFGVPFAPGALWDADGLRLVNDAGMELPCQKEVTARWAEGGAIRWLRFDALVTPGEGCRVDFAPSRAIPTMPVRIIEKNNLITVDTGAARYVLGTGKSPVKEVLLKDGRRQAFCGPQSRGLYLVTRDGRSAQVAEDSSMQIEARGPVAACVRFEGYYRDPDHDDAPLAGYVTRLEFFAGQANAAITHTLMLAADTGISQLKEVGWEMDCSFVDLEEGAAAPLAAIYAGEMDAGAMPGIIMACRKNARQDFKDLEVQPDRIVLRLLSDGAGEKLNAQSARVKTYEILIAPTAQQPEALSAAVAQAGLQPLPVYAQADPEWICQSRAMGPLCPMRRGKYAAAESKIESLWRARWLPDEHPSGGRHSVADCLDGAGNRRADCSLRHDDLWFACVRAWSRDLRNLAEDATRTCLDDFISHCLVPRKITGLYDPWHIAPVDMGANILPLGWSDCADSIADVAPNLLQFQYLYQIAGDRRGADVLRAFAAGLKTCCYRAASKVGVDDYQRGTGGYSLMMLKALALSYACDWDLELWFLLNDAGRALYDPAAATGINKRCLRQEYNGSCNKLYADAGALLDAWDVTGAPGYREMARRFGDYAWNIGLGAMPVAPLGRLGGFFYDEICRPDIVGALDFQVRRACAYNRSVCPMAAVELASDMPMMLDVLERYAESQAPTPTWLAFDVCDRPARIALRKPHGCSLAVVIHSGTNAVPGERRLTVRPLATARSGCDLITVSVPHCGPARLYFPSEAPGVDYVIDDTAPGSRLILADQAIPIVICADGDWRLPDLSPSLPVYFHLPPESETARRPRLWVEGGARFYAPDGKPWQGGVVLSDWVDLPGDQPGLWRFEPERNQRVRAVNLPPFFALGRPEFYFEPETPWNCEE